MKIQFSGNQPYQLEAIRSVVDLFEGQPLAGGPFEFRFESVTGLGFSELGCGNQLLLPRESMLGNLQSVQQRNQLPADGALDSMNFSVEMETGTGKTYVYLRTLYELHIRYGFSKFVIVVPSVAIREGVLSSIRLTREHFRTLYGNVPADLWVYDSAQVSWLRQFAWSNQMQVLVINIDPFNKKDIAVIHNERDSMSGRRPIEFIQSTRPVVVIDEPQNMESEKAKEAASLNPGRLSDVFLSPQEFLNRALSAIRKALDELFEREEISSYLSRLIEVRRSIYDVVEFESDVERRFAAGLDAREDIRLFFKLPPWLTVPTPMGEYNPDWAIVKEEEGQGKLYLIRETKGSDDADELRARERRKIECGKAHFSALGVDYRVVTSHNEV